MKHSDNQGYAGSDVFTQPFMTAPCRKIVGKICLAEKQDPTPRYRRRGKVPNHVIPNEVKRWAKHKDVQTRTNGRGETILTLG